jgi:hypothetical protein
MKIPRWVSRSLVAVGMALAVLAATQGRYQACVGYCVLAILVAVATEGHRTQRGMTPDTAYVALLVGTALAVPAALLLLIAGGRGRDVPAKTVFGAVLILLAGPIVLVGGTRDLRSRRQAGRDRPTQSGLPEGPPPHDPV